MQPVAEAPRCFRFIRAVGGINGDVSPALLKGGIQGLHDAAAFRVAETKAVLYDV